MAVVTVSAENFRRELTRLLNQVGYSGDHVVVKRHNEEIAVIVPIDLYQQLDLSRWTKPVESNGSRKAAAEQLLPVEEVARLAHEIESARIEAGISYETLAEGLRAERLTTLREKYPEYAARHDAE